MTQELLTKRVMGPRLVPPAWIVAWFRPQKTDPATFFRERTIRAFSASIFIIALVALVISFSIYSSSQGRGLFYLVTIGLSAVTISGAMIAVHQGHINTSAILLVGSFLIAAYGILIGDTYTSRLAVPLFMLVFLLWALVLPRNSLWLLLLSSVIGIPIIAFLQAPPTVSVFAVAGAMADALFPLAVEAIVLYVFRYEFDSRLENAEKARARAEAADLLKTQFLSSVSHELRTPLNAIKGYVEIMLAGMAGTFTEKQTQLQHHIHANAERLLALINDILDLAKIESGTIEILATLASPRKIVTEIVDTNQSLTRNKPVVLEGNIDETVPDSVEWDVIKVQQVLTNLVANAVKFTDQGKVSIGVTMQDANLKITVVDTGIGMPPGAANYIFDMFRQVDGTDTRKHQGTGLGLAITKRLVDKMGGTIGVESTLGKGSTFTVVLPRWMKAKAVKT